MFCRLLSVFPLVRDYATSALGVGYRVSTSRVERNVAEWGFVFGRRVSRCAFRRLVSGVDRRDEDTTRTTEVCGARVIS
jgi:hypothetical protein